MGSNSFLSEKEVNYLKWAIIYADVKDPSTREQLDWLTGLQRKEIFDEISEEELIQENRLREMDIFVSIITGSENPGTVEEIVKRYEDGYYDEMEKELYTEMVLQETFDRVEDYANLAEIKKHMIEDGQNLDEPFVQELIKEIYTSYKKDQRYEKMFNKIQSVSFNYLSQNDKYMICFIIYKELKKPLDKYMSRRIRNIDVKLLEYLLRNLTMQFDLTDSNPKKI